MYELQDYRLRQREYLLRISRAITAQLELSSVLDLVISFAVEMVAGTSGFIALADEPGDEALHIRAAHGLGEGLWPAFEPLLEVQPDGTAGHTALLRQRLQEVALATSLPLRQMIALPLTTGGRALSICCASAARSSGAGADLLLSRGGERGLLGQRRAGAGGLRRPGRDRGGECAPL
jgi:GAF domain-containing protein